MDHLLRHAQLHAPGAAGRGVAGPRSQRSQRSRGAAQVQDVRPYWTELLQGGLRMAMYSGDTDFACPTLATEWGLTSLKLPVQTPYKPWHNGGQVAGFTKQYKGMEFITVRGSGHMVPQFRPANALKMITALLANQPLN